VFAEVGDGALGFLAALKEVYPQTRHQRCRMHKTMNVLNYLPKGVQSKAGGALQEIWDRGCHRSWTIPASTA